MLAHLGPHLGAMVARLEAMWAHFGAMLLLFIVVVVVVVVVDVVVVVVVVVGTFEFGVGGLGLVGRGACVRVWGWWVF